MRKEYIKPTLEIIEIIKADIALAPSLVHDDPHIIEVDPDPFVY